MPSFRRLSLWLGLALSTGAPERLFAQEPARISFETYSLPNGLTVILAPDRSSQVVAVDVWYHVGSRDEVRGRTGFAHLFEHMMFQGSANVKKAEHFQLVEQAGGASNGSTAEDRTNYFQALPSNRLNLGLWLEADRMRSLAVTDSTFANQREAVKEERRLRVDNQPYAGAIFEGMYALADSASCFPYAHSVIGSMDDLNAAKTGDVKAFFDLYYAPNNATLTVVGDFESAEAKRLIEQYFGSIPRGKEPPPVSCESRFNSGAIRRPWPDPKANLAGVLLAYRVPEYRHADFPVIDLLLTILGQGESSRMNKSVVRDQKLAQFAVVISNPFAPRRGPGVLLAFGITNQGVSPDSLEAGLAREFARVISEGVTEAELNKAKNGYRTQLITQQQQALAKAEALQAAALFLGDPEAVNTNWKRYLAVTVADIKRVATTYFRPENSLVLLITPGGAK
ncbi:MAG TPA: pitrilysin family protein [Gemmatimonadales bacterium]|nr:pitrilysin family protein [Gemmatimonadales bacterium]